MSLKNPVTRPGIDLGTVRLVAQRPNHYATPGPIYNYIPETNHVARVHSVASALYLQSVVSTCNVISPKKYVLHFYTSTYSQMQIIKLDFYRPFMHKRDHHNCHHT
jgi:hypothetical protein